MLLAASPFDFEAFLPFAVFGLFAAIAWFVLDKVAAGQPRAVSMDTQSAPLRERPGPGGTDAGVGDNVAVTVGGEAEPRVVLSKEPASPCRPARYLGPLATAGRNRPPLKCARCDFCLREGIL